MICRKMGWDYWTYQAQPVHFINDILDYMNLEVSAEKVRAVDDQLGKKQSHNA